MSQLTQAVTAAREDALLRGGLPWVAGYVVRLDDLTSPPTPEALYAELGLGFPASPFPADAAFVDILNLPASPDLLLDSPADAADRPAITDHEPFASGSGFVDSAARFLPVWWAAPSRVPAGASIWRVSADAPPRMIAGYASVAEGWIAAPGVELPATPAQSTPLLGIRAVWRGREMISDVLPDGRWIVCGEDEFEGSELSARGLWWKEVPSGELSDVEVLRVLATWRGLPVQLVAIARDDSGENARVVYTGRDMPAAEAAGMTKTAAGVYEIVVAAGELDGVREERRSAGLADQTVQPSGIDPAQPVRIDPAQATAAQARLIEVGTQLLRRRWPDAVLDAFALDGGAVLLTQPVRGGVSLYVASDESVMFAASSLEPSAAREMFRAGRRTDPAKFEPSTEGPGAR